MTSYTVTYKEQVFLQTVPSEQHIPNFAVLTLISVDKVKTHANNAIERLARCEAIIAGTENTVEAQVARNIAANNLAGLKRDAKNATSQLAALETVTSKMIYKISSVHGTELNANKAAKRVNGVVVSCVKVGA